MLQIDLNADVGESSGGPVEDIELFQSITSANVAAGIHAGNPSVLRATIRLARASGVSVGAHPGLADRSSFGRRESPISVAEAEDLVLYQVAVVKGVAEAEGLTLRHVKPHGALYNMAARDAGLAAAIARAVSAVDPSLILFGPDSSEIAKAGLAAGLAVAAEGFADRAYQADGSLTPRSVPGAVIDQPDLVLARALQIVRDGTVVAIDGTQIRVHADTICIHSDTTRAAELARRLRSGLETAGVMVRALATRR